MSPFLAFFIILIGAFLGYLLSLTGWKFYQKFKGKKAGYSFAMDMNITDMIILRTTVENMRCVFIVDTGAATSTIDNKIISKTSLQTTPSTTKLYGLNGNLETLEMINLPFTFDNKFFTQEMYVADLSYISQKIKEDTGLTVHGILGTDFLREYKVNLNFQNSKFYID